MSRTSRRPCRRSGRSAAAVGLLLWALPALAGADAAVVRHLLALLRAVAQEYREAVDANGTVVRPLEIDEARLLLAEARAPADQLGRSADLDALARALDAHPTPETIETQVATFRRNLTAATGVDEERVPTAPPSPARGRALFDASCASCHGRGGAGDGPDAARLARRPPDFTDPLAMRDETPADFFSVISLGRRSGAMPAWGDALSVQERWDLVAFLWSLRARVVTVTAGESVFVARCAGCHAPGAGATPARADAPPLADLARMSGRSDAELQQAVAHEAPSPSEADRTALVAFVRTLSLGTTSDGAPSDVDPVARVAALVESAVAAYRLRESDAVERATRAYLAFEPLEPGIALHDAVAVQRVEAAFLRLQQALRKSDGMPEVEGAAQAIARALDGARAARSAKPAVPWLAVSGAVGALIVALLLAYRR